MRHLAVTRPSLLGCLGWGDTRCHSLIEWWLSWMEPPVFSLCENMVMQIDANDVVLYMQISHATTLLAFVLQGQTNSWVYVCGCSCLPVHVWVYVWGVCVETATSTRLQMQSILPSPINLKVLAGFTAWLTSSGSEKHSYRVLGCSSLKPQISDLYLLRNPNIVWLFLSLSALFDSQQKRVHWKGKWVAAKSVLHCESQG